ncbi:hypothetical protein LCGC14_0498500 [marine sediment metagenome]|uniref:Uncharacterized protein n=1 Tax=marine sediment metagenome TaxID=412755 RepID=A0A0F9URH7_9ZZZZ
MSPTREGFRASSYLFRDPIDNPPTTLGIGGEDDGDPIDARDPRLHDPTKVPPFPPPEGQEWDWNGDVFSWELIKVQPGKVSRETLPWKDPETGKVVNAMFRIDGQGNFVDVDEQGTPQPSYVLPGIPDVLTAAQADASTIQKERNALQREVNKSTSEYRASQKELLDLQIKFEKEINPERKTLLQTQIAQIKANMETAKATIDIRSRELDSADEKWRVSLDRLTGLDATQADQWERVFSRATGDKEADRAYREKVFGLSAAKTSRELAQGDRALDLAERKLNETKEKIQTEERLRTVRDMIQGGRTVTGDPFTATPSGRESGDQPLYQSLGGRLTVFNELRRAGFQPKEILANMGVPQEEINRLERTGQLDIGVPSVQIPERPLPGSPLANLAGVRLQAGAVGTPGLPGTPRREPEFAQAIRAGFKSTVPGVSGDVEEALRLPSATLNLRRPMSFGGDQVATQRSRIAFAFKKGQDVSGLRQQLTRIEEEESLQRGLGAAAAFQRTPGYAQVIAKERRRRPFFQR